MDKALENHKTYKTKTPDCAWIAQHLFTACSGGSRGGARGGGGGSRRPPYFASNKKKEGRKKIKADRAGNTPPPPIPLRVRYGSATGLY